MGLCIRLRVPSEATIRQVLGWIDAEGLDRVIVRRPGRTFGGAGRSNGGDPHHRHELRPSCSSAPAGRPDQCGCPPLPGPCYRGGLTIEQATSTV